jgi:hypothetical protein
MIQTLETANGLVIVSDSLADIKHARTISDTFSYRTAKLVIWIAAKEIFILKNEDNLKITIDHNL